MAPPRKERWRQRQSAIEPGFGWMLVLSLLLHLLLPVFYTFPLFPKAEPPKAPVYRVNLVNKAVERPQAGRPEVAASEKPPTAPQPAPLKSEPKPKPKPKPLPPKPQPVEVKPKAKPAPVLPPRVSKAQEAAKQRAMEQLREKLAQQRAKEEREKERERLKAQLAAALKSPVEQAPVGSVLGKGDQAGVSPEEKVAEYLQQQWRLSKYQVPSLDLEASVSLVYNAEGTRIYYNFEQKSGNLIFDRTILDTLAKTAELGFALPKTTRFEVKFNLKDLRGAQ